MKYIVIVFAVLTLVFISCKGDQPQEELPAAEGSISLEEINVQFPELIEEARDAVIGWSVFQELENDIKRLNQGSLKRFSGETERMVMTSDSLLKNIPPSLNTLPISSRMRVLNTRIKLLDEVIHQPGSDSIAMITRLNETNKSFSNLLFQINQTFLKARMDELIQTEQNIEQNPLPKRNDTL